MTAPPSQVTVVGAGAMGTLCALLLAEKGVKVRIWGRSPDLVEALNREKENRRYLPGHSLPDCVRAVHPIDEALEGADLIISAVPCQFLASVWSQMAPHLAARTPVVSTTKGIEIGSLRLPTEIIQSFLGDVPLACLSGPNIAPEIAEQKPAGAVIASPNESLAAHVQEMVATDYFRTYRSSDMIGVELAGAVKNVIALAAGICDGVGAGDNAKAALLTRGLVEISRLGTAMGAKPETFAGLAGLGDLFTTCVSKVGRNRTAGERIGRGEAVADVEATTQSIIEGIPTAKSVLALADNHQVDLPIVRAVAAVLFEEVRPADAIHALMTRKLGPE